MPIETKPTFKERIKANPKGYAKSGVIVLVALVYGIAAFAGYVPPEGLQNILTQLMSVLMLGQ